MVTTGPQDMCAFPTSTRRASTNWNRDDERAFMNKHCMEARMKDWKNPKAAKILNGNKPDSWPCDKGSGLVPQIMLD